MISEYNFSKIDVQNIPTVDLAAEIRREEGLLLVSKLSSVIRSKVSILPKVQLQRKG